MKEIKSKMNLEAIKDTLCQRKQILEQEFISLQANNVADDPAQDPGDQANAAALETLQSSLQSNQMEEYKMILKAIEMIDKGEYGICIDCEQSISERRLASYPNATRCIACQETLEENQRNKQEDSFF